MFAEEQFLRKKFGDIYDKWSETVSSFIPFSFKFIRSKASIFGKKCSEERIQQFCQHLCDIHPS